MSTALSPNVPPTCSIESAAMCWIPSRSMESAAMCWIPSRQIKGDPCGEVASLVGLRKCDEAAEKFFSIPVRAYLSIYCSYDEMFESIDKCFEKKFRATLKTADPCGEVASLLSLRKCDEAANIASSVPERAYPFLSCSRHEFLELLESVTKCSEEEAAAYSEEEAAADWHEKTLSLFSKVSAASASLLVGCAFGHYLVLRMRAEGGYVRIDPCR